MTTLSASRPLDRALTRVLRDHRRGLADAFAQGFDLVPRWASLAEQESGARDSYLATHFQVFADYLAEHSARPDDTFKNLFVGECVKSLHDAALEGPARRRLAEQVLEAHRERVRALLDGKLASGSLARVDEFLQDVQRTLCATLPRTQHVLLVGDCIFLDIMPFIVGELMRAGISLVAEYATSKNTVVLCEELKAAGVRRFDAVFFSPFSYEFSLPYAQVLKWRRGLMKGSMVRAVVEQAWEETRRTVDLLADLFDCPIHVHNSAAIIREEGAVKRLAKLRATARIRAVARTHANALLQRCVASKNSESFEHLFVLDEQRLVATAGEAAAGAYFYKSALQHPARLGQILSAEYVDLLYVTACLLKRKVVVCDLDNTLWGGAIGEGDVVHFHDRQRILKALKEKGVVLAINSKNDPANVHWRGGTLSDEDFVSASISWEPKVHGMRRIQSALNLKTKDYVFVDDRQDELELMRSSYADMACVDATEPATWRRLALWARLLEGNLEADRTAMYRQREERKAFVKEDIVSDEERDQVFASLGLQLVISAAKGEDLKRVAELINRTNQFNLEGSRVTLREVSDWHRSPSHLVILGRTADRFGDMGTTCVAVARFEGDQMRLLTFVLSCRVFGYGIEQGVMAHLLACARERGARRVVGRYVGTPQNAPCRNFLEASGFVPDGDAWVREPDSSGPTSPSWLSVSIR